MPGIQELSERELEILRLVATGASNKEIAKQCFISANTVKVHLRNIFSKIGVSTRTEAAIYAVNAGLVPSSLENKLVDQLVSPGEPLPDGQIEQVSVDPRRKKTIKWLVGGFTLLVILLAAYWLATRQTRQNTLVGMSSPAESSRWQTRQKMPTPRSNLALVSFENSIYSIAGDTDQVVTNAVDRYEPETNTWTSLSSKPTAVSEISAAIIGGKIYVPGGRLASGAISNQLEIYDIHLDNWSAGQALPEAVCGYALIAYEGKLYLLGGWNGTSPVSTVYLYDPATDRWVEKSAMPTARAYMGAVLAGGQIYVFGGFDGKKALNVSEIYTPEQDYTGGAPWKAGAPLPEARYQMGVASFADFILIVGGINDKKVALPSYEYFITDQTWLNIGSLGNKPWSRLGVVAVGSQLYVLGGLVDGKSTDQNLSYQAIYTMNMPIIR